MKGTQNCKNNKTTTNCALNSTVKEGSCPGLSEFFSGVETVNTTVQHKENKNKISICQCPA